MERIITVFAVVLMALTGLIMGVSKIPPREKVDFGDPNDPMSHAGLLTIIKEHHSYTLNLHQVSPIQVERSMELRAKVWDVANTLRNNIAKNDNRPQLIMKPIEPQRVWIVCTPEIAEMFVLGGDFQPRVAKESEGVAPDNTDKRDTKFVKFFGIATETSNNIPYQLAIRGKIPERLNIIVFTVPDTTPGFVTTLNDCGLYRDVNEIVVGYQDEQLSWFSTYNMPGLLSEEKLDKPYGAPKYYGVIRVDR